MDSSHLDYKFVREKIEGLEHDLRHGDFKISIKTFDGAQNTDWNRMK